MLCRHHAGRGGGGGGGGSGGGSRRHGGPVGPRGINFVPLGSALVPIWGQLGFA